MKIRAIAAAVGMVLLAGRLSYGQEKVVVPGRAVSAETSFVVWVDVESATAEGLKKAQAAVEGAGSAESAAAAKDGWKKVGEFRQVFTGAGGRGVMVVSGSAAGGAGATTEPGGETLVLAKLKARTDPAVFVTKVREYVAGVAKEKHAAPGDLAKLDTIGIEKLGDGWFYLTGPADAHLAKPGAGAAPAEVVGAFNDALNANAGASVRVAVRTTDAMRLSLKMAATDPNNFIFRGLAKGLISLQTASAGLWVDENPRIGVSMNFEDKAGATQFQQTLGGMVSLVGMMSGLGAGRDPAQQADAALFRAAMAPLLMEQKDATLTTTIDTTLLRKITELQAKKAAAATQRAATRAAAPAAQ